MTTDSKGQTFIFQFSCIQSDFRSKLESQISQLNGKFDSTSKELLPTCTHLVVSALSRTEKFLSALAKGLWIVEPSYIETCSRAKKWLDPELHEWSIPCLTADDSDQVIRGDIGRRRRLSRIKSNKLAFSGWTCAVTDVTPKQRYERILRHGGAKVVQSDEKLTHLFTEEMPPEGSRNKHTAVSVMFIGAYLLMDNVKMSDFPPSILENSVKVLGDNNTSNRTALVGKKLSTQKSLKRQLTLEESFDFGNNAKKRKFFGGLLCQSNSDSSTCNSPLRQKSQSNKSAASNLKQTGKDIVKRSLFHNDENTNKKTCKSGVVAKTITTISKKVLPNRISRGKAAPKYDEDYNSPLPWSSKKSGTTPSRTTPSRTTPGRTTPKQYTGKALNKLQPSNVKSQSKLISNEKSEQTKCQSRRKNNQSSRDAVATRESCRVNLFDKKINMQPRVVLKRLDEKTIQNFGMQKRDTPVKKKRVHYSSANIALAMKRLAARKKSQSSNKRMPHHPSLLPMSFVSVNEPLSVNRSLSINQSLPMPLPTVMYNLFEATLGGMPEVSLQIVNHYITKLRYPNCSLIRDVLHLIKTCPEQTSIMAYLTMKRLLDIHPPHTIREVYAHAFGATEDDTEFVQKTAINSVLSVIKYCVYENSTEDIACQPVTVNFQNYCRAFQVIIAILDADANLVQCVDKYKCKTLICQFIWGSGNIGIMNSNVRKILQYFVDSIELAEYKVSSLLARLITIIVETAFDRNIPSESLHLFAMEFAQHLKLCKNTSLLEIAFNKIHPSWLSQMICEKMLDQYDNSLLSNLEPQNEICLGSMISKSFYLHPTFKQLISTPHKKKQSTPPKQVAQRNPAAKWRNSRGESKLHRACITNNIPQVKQLLATPGVNVNAADNYGWTALHECCNHGHVECVKLLLAHKPVMSMESFLNKATKHCDTRAVSKDGTTPLHDAVNNGQTSIAVLLLRHSGADLLTLRNLDGQLPVDKAETEEMKTALQNYDDDSQSTEILSFPSQSSQGSNDGVCHSKLACCQRPSAEVYDWVLGVRNDNNPSSKQAASHTGVPTGTTPHQRQCSPESCALFLCILHQYVSSYLENNNLIELHAELCAIQGGELGAGDSDIIVSDSDIKAAQRDLKVLRYFDCHVTGLSQHIELLCEEYLSSQNNSPNNVITEECSNIQKYLRNLYLLCHS